MVRSKAMKDVYLRSLAVLVAVIVGLVALFMSTGESESEPVAPGPPGYLHDVSRGELA